MVVETYDPHCETLAEEFLSEEPATTAELPLHRARVRHLSLAIQQAIEEWFADNPYPQPAGEEV